MAYSDLTMMCSDALAGRLSKVTTTILWSEVANGGRLFSTQKWCLSVCLVGLHQCDVMCGLESANNCSSGFGAPLQKPHSTRPAHLFEIDVLLNQSYYNMESISCHFNKSEIDTQKNPNLNMSAKQRGRGSTDSCSHIWSSNYDLRLLNRLFFQEKKVNFDKLTCTCSQQHLIKAFLCETMYYSKLTVFSELPVRKLVSIYLYARCKAKVT